MASKDVTLAIDISEEEFSNDESFEQLFEESIQDEKVEGSVVKGKIVAIENDLAIVDVGLKSEGIVSIKEFSIDNENENMTVGDEVEVFLERIEGRDGKTILSREKAVRESAWERLETISKEGETVNGTIFGRVKGGFTVDVQGVVAFLPGSQVDIRPVKDIAPLMGISQPFQILKMDRKQGNIVVSRRAILEESRIEARDELLAQISEGQIMKGVVKNITDYGAFIDLGSVDGLLHVTDISWGRISHPSEILTLGQEIDVKVIKYNPETKRISLGMKQLDNNPWDGIGDSYAIGNEVKGVVTNITDYGAFVELQSGIEGLVHVSEISWIKNNTHPRKLLSVGQEVTVKVLEIDPEKHRISLGIKQCENNPWASFAANHPVGEVVEGEIKNIVEFGLFVGFEGGIDGLVHISDLAWDVDPEEEIKKFSKGQNISVKILVVDVDKQRISLGIKQLEKDPLEGLFSELKKGSVVTCTVVEVAEDGIEVSIKDSATSFIKKADLSRDRVEQRPERFALGNRVDAKVVSIDKDNRKIQLSIKSLEMDEHKKAIAEYGSTDSGASLGDILGAAIEKTEEEKKADK